MVNPIRRKPLHRQLTFPYQIVRGTLLASLSSCAGYASGTLLDLGCGRQPYRELLGAKVSHYVGLDLHGTPEVFASVLQLPIRSDACDTVLCTEVLEHLPEPRAALQEMQRVLRPGGHLIVTVPQWWPLHEEPDDYYRFTCHGLTHLIAQAGFSLIEMTPRGNSALCGAQRRCDHLCRRFNWPAGMGTLRRRAFELGCGLIQLSGYAMARLFRDSSDVLGWTAVAKKS